MRIGYVRTSTADQSPQLQLDALEAAGVEKVYIDHGVSGTKASRPELDRMLEQLRDGDEIVVWKLDRLARNTRHLLELVDSLRARGVQFSSLTEGLTTTGPMGRALLTIMGALAELERDQLVERTHAGLAAAAKSGRHGGRPKALTARQAEKVRRLRAEGVAVGDIAKVVGIGRATAYRYLSEASA